MDRTRFFALAALCVLGLALPARADVIQWGFIAIFPGTADGGIIHTIFSDALAGNPDGGSLFLTGNSNTNGHGSSGFTPLTVTVPEGAAGRINTVSHNGYSLLITLSDYASGQHGTLDFNGQISGSFSPTSAGPLTNTFLTPSQSVRIGDNLYTVTMGPLVQPTPLNATSAGIISGHVDVTPVSDAPEPSSLLLGGLGLTGGLLGRRRRTRRASAG